MGIVDALLAKIQGQRIYFDANFLIYFFDKTEPYITVVSQIILACDRNEVLVVQGMRLLLKLIDALHWPHLKQVANSL